MPFHPRVWVCLLAPPPPTLAKQPVAERRASPCMKTPSDDGTQTQGEGSGFLEGLAPNPSNTRSPLRRILLGEVSLTAEG